MGDSYRLGPFFLDAGTGVLSRDGSPVALGKRAVAVLAVLVRSPQSFVPKEQILASAWPGLVVQENNLAVQILSIRRALAQADGGDAWLETLAKRGYRFVGPVEPADARPASAVIGAVASNLPEPLTSFVMSFVVCSLPEASRMFAGMATARGLAFAGDRFLVEVPALRATMSAHPNSGTRGVR